MHLFVSCPAVDHCKSSPCKHGQCVSNEHGYQCHCDNGWTGQHCDSGNELF